MAPDEPRTPTGQGVDRFGTSGRHRRGMSELGPGRTVLKAGWAGSGGMAPTQVCGAGGVRVVLTPSVNGVERREL